jgi:hypothetical protein
MDESLTCKGRWLKMMMKHVIAVVEQWIGLVKRISNIEIFIGIEADGKISLQVFGGHASHDSFIKSSIFSCSSASHFSSNHTDVHKTDVWAKNVPSVLELLHHLPHNTVCITPHPCQCNLH